MALYAGGNLKDLTDRNSGGTRFGQTTSDKICFFGTTTAIVQPVGAAQAAVATAAITTLTAGPSTAETVAAVNSVIARVSSLVGLSNELRADLVALGLIKGSA